MTCRRIITAAAAALLLLPFLASARRIRTGATEVEKRTDSGYVIPGSVIHSCSPGDTRAPLLTGYDKRAGSDTESFFITNRADSILTSFTIELTYLASDSTQLHRRTVTRRCDIAPGETMRHDIRSWDRQHSFYYHKSMAPRGKYRATPYLLRTVTKAYSLRKKR